MSKKALVTGGAGFIGSSFIKLWLQKDHSIQIINLDKLTYAGDLSRLSSVEKNPRYQFVKGDVNDAAVVKKVMKGVDYVVHFAAETHVDRSILDGKAFLETNVLGTHTLLEQARLEKIQRFLLVSTDEVYGSRQKGYFTENDALSPSSPYSSSKAAADLLTLSYYTTYNLPVVITRGANTYGPYQYPEKVIPLFVSNALSGEKLPLYGDGKQVRNWIYVDDHALAILHALKKGKDGQVYNISSETELQNIQLTKKLLNILGLGMEWIVPVQDRLGHDRRYAISSKKLRGLGWSEKHQFEKAFKATVLWYKENQSWWKTIKEKQDSFKRFYKKAYQTRLHESKSAA